MSYREPAPHVHVYDVEHYVPPHYWEHVCVCGARKPPALWERAAWVVVDLVVAALAHPDDDGDDGP